jgi:hypothetical protein
LVGKEDPRRQYRRDPRENEERAIKKRLALHTAIAYKDPPSQQTRGSRVMPNNVIIVTNCGTDSHDYELLFKAYSVFPENLNEMDFKHMVLQRGYELAEETFKHSLGHDNFMYAEDSEQGYTVLKSTFYIDEQTVIWYEEGEMETIHYYGESHECWVKPEEGKS